MANRWQVRLLQASVDRWNQWRKRNPEIKIDLSGAQLSRTQLSGAHLWKADLNETNLSGAHLSEADLRGADLRNAGLWGADLSRAHLSGAQLFGTHLSGTRLLGTYLREADLRGADLNAARLGATSFGHSNLSDVCGLHECRHQGPSYLDHFTLMRSGHLPDLFLRGCGYLDWQIEAAKLHQKGLTQQNIIDIAYRIADLKTDDPVQYNSCFISYSTKDEAFCQKLYDRLQEAGIRTWYAPHNMPWG